MKKAIAILALIVVFSSIFLVACNTKTVETPDPSWEDDFDFLGKVYEYVKEGYISDVNVDELDRAAASAIIRALDPFSYISDNSIPLVDSASIGIFLSVSKYNEYRITHVVEGMPASREIDGFKLSRGDEIYAVNGERVEGLPSSGFSELTAGGVGTTLALTVKRNGEIVGEYSYEKSGDAMPTAYYIGDLGDTGYIKLTSFSDGRTDEGTIISTNRLFDECVNQFKKDGKTSLILDLRDNPGGSSLILAHVASYFVPLKGSKQDILSLKYEKTGDEVLVSVTENNYLDVPVAVLVNGNSASAAEALTGACRAFNPHATIIGEPTFGKGVFQSSPKKISDKTWDSDKTFESSYYVYLVAGYYYIIDEKAEGGRYNIHNNPINPDVVVKPNEKIGELSTDAEIVKALEILK